MKKAISIVCAIIVLSMSFIALADDNSAISYPPASYDKPYNGEFCYLPVEFPGIYVHYANGGWTNAWQVTNIGIAHVWTFIIGSTQYAVTDISGTRYGYGSIANNGVSITASLTGYSGYYYLTGNASSGEYYTSPFTFSNLQEAMLAVEASLDDTPVIQGGSLNYSLPPGNIAIIETTGNYSSIKMNTTMPLISTSFSQNPWPNTTQRIGYYNNLPSSINPSTMGNVIEWQKTGDTTLFGNTNNAQYQPSVISKFNYVVVSNPYYYPANNMEDNQFTNGSINIRMDDVVNIEIRNLTATVNTSTGAIENNPNGTTWTGTIDEDTGDITWTDNNGENTSPGDGGNLSDPTISGFQSWLKGILTSIRDIFEPAHDAIQTLSSAVRNFAGWMYALYIWLPSPILNLLISAISLAIVIGVIKVFI